MRHVAVDELPFSVIMLLMLLLLLGSDDIGVRRSDNTVQTFCRVLSARISFG